MSDWFPGFYVFLNIRGAIIWDADPRLCPLEFVKLSIGQHAESD